MRILNRRRALTALAAISVFAVAGVAYAYWTTTGSGTGSATTGSSAPVTVTQTGTVAGLYPGGPPQPIAFKITNPGPGKQYIATVTASISSITVAGNPAVGCTAADFDLVQPTAIGADLAAGDTAFSPSGATLALKDTGSNQNGCKNATVNLAFAAA